MIIKYLPSLFIKIKIFEHTKRVCCMEEMEQEGGDLVIGFNEREDVEIGEVRENKRWMRGI
jgi:hypothetical protein